MTKLPSLSSKELVRALRKAGFENAPKRGKGSHVALVRRMAGSTRLVIVPDRKILPKGTLRAILEQAGITRDDFLAIFCKNFVKTSSADEKIFVIREICGYDVFSKP